MKVIKIVIWSLAAFMVLLVIFMGYMGLLKPLKPVIQEKPVIMMIGVNVMGSYSEAGEHAEMVRAMLKGTGFEHTPGIGVYYSDPQKAPAVERKSFVGQVFDARDLQRVIDLHLSGLQIDSLPAGRFVSVVLPVKNKLSYMLGPMKAYKVLGAYCRENHYSPGPGIEIYDQDNGRIVYMMQCLQPTRAIDY